MNTKQRIEKHPAVAFVDDERSLGNSIIVTLKDGYDFSCEPGCGVRGYDTFGDALREVRHYARSCPVCGYVPATECTACGQSA